MKSLKTLLALGVAMAVSATSFAETATPLNGTKEAVKSTMESKAANAKNTATTKAATAKETLNSVKNGTTNAVDNVKNTAADKMNATKSSATNKASSAKNAVTEKAGTVKTKAAEKTTVSANKVTKAAKVNINKADAKTLQTLSGIGEAKAQAIIDYRNKAGKIKNAAELSNIPGVGDATIEKIAPYLTF